MTNNFDSQRDEIIDRIYDLIIQPDKANDFVGVWESYITELSSKYDNRENATGLSDVILSDQGLEVHFARVYAILEGQGRNKEDQIGDQSKDAEALFKFDIDGTLLRANPSNPAIYAKVKTAKDIAHILSFDAAKNWELYLKKTKRAPSIDNIELFALKTGGNLIAHNKREDGSSNIQIVVNDLVVKWSQRLRSLLKEQFGLTKSELQLLEKLTVLGSLETVTKQSTRSKNTLRTQLQSAFRKMNVASQQAALQSIAMLAHFCESIGYKERETSTTVNQGELVHIDIDGGISVPVHFFGPEDGHPVIFIHGMLDGITLTDRIVKALYKHKLRFISPIRPNFGMAISDPNIEKAPEVFASQLKQLVKKLGLSNVILLGHMSGGLFGFAASPVLGKRVAGLVNISCGVPILSTKQFSNLSRRQKAFAYTTRYAPRILPALLRVGVAQIDSVEIETLMDDMYPKDSPDKIVLQDPKVAAVILDGYRFAVAQGYKGFQGDALQVTRNWSEYVNANDKPVLLIHGKHDPAAASEYVPPFAKKEGFQLHMYPKDGQLLLYSKPNKILGDIRNFIDEITERNGGASI